MTAPFEPTEELRAWVTDAAKTGASHALIAQALEISRPTLEKHFALELRTGAARRRMEILDGLYRAAMRGKVSAVIAFWKAGNRVWERGGRQ